MKNNDYKKVGNTDYIDNNYTERPDMNSYASDIMNNEISNGRKRSKPKKHKKADHKHNYIEVILREEKTNPVTGKKNYRAMLGEKCTICSQIKVKNWLLSERLEDGYYKLLNYKEIVEKYKDLEIIDIE